MHNARIRGPREAYADAQARGSAKSGGTDAVTTSHEQTKQIVPDERDDSPFFGTHFAVELIHGHSRAFLERALQHARGTGKHIHELGRLSPLPAA